MNQIIEIKCEAKSAIQFTPVREPGSRFGRFEVWRECEQGETGPNAIGLVPTGGWVVWDSATKHMIGFPGEIGRRHAEELAVANNEGAPTRIFDPLTGAEEESAIKLGPWIIEASSAGARIRHSESDAIEELPTLDAAFARARALNGDGCATRFLME